MSHKIKVQVEDEKITLDMPYRTGFASTVMGAILTVVSFLQLLVVGTSMLSFSFGQPMQYVKVFVSLVYIGLIMFLGLSFFIRVEHVEIKRSGINLEHWVLKIPLSRHWFDKNCIQGLFISRVFEQIDWPRTGYGQFKTGRIGFNIEKTFWGQINTIRFGSALNEGRAREILALIFEHFPEYRLGQVKSRQIQ
jgi:hypothetical protein